MAIEIIIQDSESGKIYDVSELVARVSVETFIEGQPGRMTFSLIRDDDLNISHGSVVKFSVEDSGVFFGFVFKSIKNAGNLWQFIAYDQLRYLKNKDTCVFKDATASDIFEKLCSDFGLEHKIVTASRFTLPPKVYDGTSLADMMQDAIGETLRSTGEYFFIRDNFGCLEIQELSKTKLNVSMGDNDKLFSYTITESIDEDTYNQVKLSREDKEGLKRAIYIKKDSSNIKKWGILQYHGKINEDMSDASIEDRATNILKIKNRQTKTFEIEGIGDIQVYAGCWVSIGIDDEDISRDFLVTSCSHTFANDLHTMKLSLEMGA